MKRMTLRISDELNEEIQAICSKNKINANQFIVASIKKYIVNDMNNSISFEIEKFNNNILKLSKDIATIKKVTIQDFVNQGYPENENKNFDKCFIELMNGKNIHE